jgi:hypothetical protein
MVQVYLRRGLRHPRIAAHSAAVGDQRWVEVLDAIPPNAEWVSSYNRIAFDTAFGVMAFREIERTLKKTDPISPNRLAQVNSYLAGLLGWCLGEVD